MFWQCPANQLHGRETGEEVTEPEGPQHQGNGTARLATDHDQDEPASATSAVVERPGKYGTVTTSPPHCARTSASGRSSPE